MTVATVNGFAGLQFRPATARLVAALLAGLLLAGSGLVRAADPATEPADDQAFRRKPLLPLVQPLWSELKPAHQEVLAPFEPQWNTLPIEEKRAWIALAGKFPKMSAAEKRRVEKRIQEWAELTPVQRKLARQNYRLARQLPDDERVAQWEQYQTLTPEQREILERNGWTSNTAARHAGSRTALAKEAAQPLSEAARANGRSSGGSATGVTGLVPTRN